MKHIIATIVIILIYTATGCTPFWSESLIGVQATVHTITPPPTSQPAPLTLPATKAD